MKQGNQLSAMRHVTSGRAYAWHTVRALLAHAPDACQRTPPCSRQLHQAALGGSPWGSLHCMAWRHPNCRLRSGWCTC